MEPSKDAISVRIGRLGAQLWGRSAVSLLGAGSTGKRALTREALLDTLTVLYEECNKDSVKKSDEYILKFIEKYRSIISDLRQLRVNITDFEIKDLIGRGYFGEVHVVREKQTGDVYAMKTLKKEMTLRHMNIAFFEEERDIMAISHSDWLVKLQYAFQDDGQLYLIMEYCPGGDLAGLLERKGRPLLESDAVFYIAELIQALKDLHSLGFIHRDVKPDNVLFDRCGHIKLGDFGSAARLSTLGKLKASMPIGTTDYIAPEILMSLENSQKYSHGIPCDFWSLGVVAYELVTCQTPFRHPNKNVVDTYNNIIEHGKNKDIINVKFPKEFDDSLTDGFKELVNNLLHPVPNHRPTSSNISKFKVFKNVSWNSLRKQVPPFVPVVNSQDDTSNFVELNKEEANTSIENFRNKSTFNGKNLPFIGFTYTPDVYLTSETNAENDTINKTTSSTSSGDYLTAQSGFLNTTVNGTAFCLTNFREVELLAETRKKEIEALHKELASLKSKGNFTDEKEKRLIDTDNKRFQLEKDLSEMACLNQRLQNQLELEHKSRQILETKSLQLIRSAKKKWKESTDEQVQELNKIIKSFEMDQTELNDENRKLKSQLDSMKSDLVNVQTELDTLKQLQTTHKESMAKARKLSRQSIVGIEQISLENSIQVQNLTQNLKKEIELKSKLESELKQCRNELKIFEEREENLLFNLRKDKERFTDEITSLNNKYDEKCQELSDARIQIMELEDANRELKNNSKLLQQKEKTLEERLKDSNCNSYSKINEFESKIKHLESKVCSYEFENKNKDKRISVLNKDKENFDLKLNDYLNNEKKFTEKITRLESTISSLQDTISSLESTRTELEKKLSSCPVSPQNIAHSERITVMQEQIDGLEDKLKVAREEVVLLKQEARKANSALWKKEKELSDCDLDRRIACRELKQAEEKVTTLQTELKEVNVTNETSIKDLKENLKKKSEDLEKAEQSLKSVQSALTEVEDKLKKTETNANQTSKTKALAEQKMSIEIKNFKEKVESLENEIKHNDELKSKLETLVETLRKDLKSTEAERNSEKELRVRLEVMCHEKIKDLDSLQMNFKALQGACTLLEEQLIDFERVTEILENNVAQSKDENASLRLEIDNLKENSAKDKKMIDIHKFTSLSSEMKIKELGQKLDDEKNKNSDLEKQINDILNHESSMSSDLNSKAVEMAQLEAKLRHSANEIRALHIEINSLKEECTRLMSDSTRLREDNMEIQLELIEQKDSNAALRSEIEQRDEELSAQQFHWQQRDMKAEATISQQIKLIDYLQSKVEEVSKRKKTFSDMFFGKSTKENIPPLTPQTPSSLRAPVNDVSKELMREKSRNKDLMNQIEILQGKLKRTPSNNGNAVERIPSDKMLYESSVKMQKGAVLARVILKLYPDRLEWISEKDRSHEKLYFIKDSNKLVRDISKENVNIVLSDCEKKFGFIVKVNDAVRSTQTLIVCSSVHQKEIWLTHIQNLPIFSDDEPNSSNSKMTLTEKPLIRFSHNPNFIVELSDDFFLIGANDGLFSFMRGRHEEPVRIENSYGAIAAKISANIDRIVILTVKKQLIHYSLRQFSADLKSTVLSTIQTQSLPPHKEIGLSHPNDSCLMFELSSLKNASDVVHLAVATASKIIIFKYDSLRGFVQLRNIETGSVNCMKFSEHSLIFGSDKIYEVDLKNFYTEEFLDVSDSSLLHAAYAYKKNIHPIDILQIKTLANDKSIEYLLCYSAFGVFVDEYGQRSRPDDIKWTHSPARFAYSKPFIFIFNTVSVEIVQLKNDSYLKTDMDTASTNSLSSNACNPPQRITLAFDSMKYLGKTDFNGLAYIVQPKANSAEIFELDGGSIFEKYLGEPPELDDVDCCNESKTESISDGKSVSDESAANINTDFAANIREKARLMSSFKRENEKITSIQKLLSKNSNSDDSDDESSIASLSENKKSDSSSGYLEMNRLAGNGSTGTASRTASDICKDMFVKKQVKFS